MIINDYLKYKIDILSLNFNNFQIKRLIKFILFFLIKFYFEETFYFYVINIIYNLDGNRILFNQKNLDSQKFLDKKLLILIGIGTKKF